MKMMLLLRLYSHFKDIGKEKKWSPRGMPAVYKLIEELNNILGWVDELKKVDTEKIEPMLSVFNESMVMRKDEVFSETSDELVLKNAPESKSGFFVVPKVVE